MFLLPFTRNYITGTKLSIKFFNSDLHYKQGLIKAVTQCTQYLHKYFSDCSLFFVERVVGKPGRMTFCCSSPQRLLRFLFVTVPSLELGV